jgi:peptidoglycan hydrolase CwlO-like protein
MTDKKAQQVEETVQSNLNVLNEKRINLRDTVKEQEGKIEALYTKKLKDAVDAIKETYSGSINSLTKEITELENSIKESTRIIQHTVNGESLRAVWSKGRTSWNTDSLEGYAVVHPEILIFKTVGDPSVSIRE